MWFETVNKFYNDKLYKNEDVKVFVEAKMIKEEEYKKITGEDYVK